MSEKVVWSMKVDTEATMLKGSMGHLGNTSRRPPLRGLMENVGL